MIEILHDTKIRFVKYQGFCVLLSAIFIAISAFYWFSSKDKLGTDFTGGTEIVVKSSVELATINKLLPGDKVVSKRFDEGEYVFKFPLEFDAQKVFANEKLSDGFVNFLRKKGIEAEVLQVDFVGPVIGEELKKKAALAVALGLVMILLYVTIRFEFAFALGGVVAIFHDVIVGTGIYIMSGFQLSMSSLAAILTIIGYSINDTIVLFDRIRDELDENGGNLSELVDKCINLTLSRTILTSLLTLLAVIALMIFGGGAISDLSFFMCVGIIVGTYSTVYIACPVVMWWHRMSGGGDYIPPLDESVVDGTVEVLPAEGTPPTL